MKYLNNKNQLDLPWVESPFFEELLKNNDHSVNEIELARKFNSDGYVVIDLDLSQSDIDLVVQDMRSSIDRENLTKQAEHFTYSNSPRIFEEWKHSKNIKNLCLHPKLIETLEFLYNKKVFPFSTINFMKGSNQPLHSDTINFPTIPQLWMSGVWVALEDTTAENGTLSIVPGSHKLPIFDYANLQLPHPDDREDGESNNYKDYEEFVRQLIKANGIEPTPVPLKKGQALIWAANLLHGGTPIDENIEQTRLTQAIHYFYEGCSEYYHPMFSNIFKGKFASKWCDEENNIKTL